MIYYAFLIVALLLVLALCWALWQRTQSIVFMFGMAVLYYWSLHGGWAIVTDRLGGDSQQHYHYLYDKMFPVYLDQNYGWTLGLYTIFVLIAGLAALYWARPVELPREPIHPIILSHDRIIIVGGIAALASFWIMRDSLSGALQIGKSGYVLTRSSTEDVGLFRVHQILNRIALLPPSLGLATLLAGGRCRFFVGAWRMRHLIGYGVVLGFVFCFCVALGNKNELAIALFSGCLFYNANSTRPRTLQLASCGVALLACVGFIDYARAFSIDEIVSNVSVGEIVSSLTRLVESNEAYAAHMSLYGVLDYEIPLTYGSSIYSFLMSVVPRAFWPDRPDDIYWYYVNGVGAAEGQGYSIHHATGWYLNFGVAGVIVGACSLGYLWAALYNNVAQSTRQLGSSWWRVFCIIGFFTFSASLPTIIRSGPEIYKSVIVESFFVPVAILTMARVPKSAIATGSARQSHRIGHCEAEKQTSIATSGPQYQLSST